MDTLLPLDSAVDSSPRPEDSDTGPPPGDPSTLDVRFLAVGGFHLSVGADALITAPLYTNPNLWDTMFEPVASDPEVIDRYLGDVSDARAVLVGHAHYDHLLDVPYVRNQSDDAAIYGNESVAHLLRAFQDTEECTDTATADPALAVPFDRVVDVSAAIDYRNCGGVETCQEHADDEAGAWITVEGANIRLRALCSLHPDQVWIIHFGQGCMDDPLCAAPSTAGDWLEGTTLAWLIDFLDAEGNPTFRVYYQDAPTDPPVGMPSDEDLAEKAVDLALLNAGNYDAVEDHPGGTIRALNPRYVIMGHWEDFFRTLDEPVQPLPFMDLDDLRARLEAELPGGEDVSWWIPDPGTEFSFEAG
jgi:L-ascorbate metabolism protein UlaG (beta-lactamase superfamily)